MTLTLENTAVERVDLPNSAAPTGNVGGEPGEDRQLPTQDPFVSVVLKGGHLTLELERHDLIVVAIDAESGLFGEGSTVEEAVGEVLTHLSLSLGDLSQHDGFLSPAMATELARLRSLFGE